jgi:tRNA A37 threonylcarbamoyladenosine biosynthesis protein TsaE
VQELLDLALDEGAGAAGVTIVEWGDLVLSALGPERLEVRLERPDEVAGDGDLRDDERVITFTPLGSSWPTRLRALTPTVDAPLDAVIGEV